MKVVAAYLLALLNGKAPSPDDVKGILASVGVDVEEDRLERFYELIDGKDVNELLQLGTQKFASGGGGGGGAVVASSAAAGGGGSSAAAAPAEEKKEEKKEEKEESEEEEMGFGLFDE